MPTVAFVAGATGFVGSALVQVLRAQGIRTIAHIRPDSAQRETWAARWQAIGAEVDASPWQTDAMAETLRRQGVTLVFGCIGTTRKRKSRSAQPQAETYQAIDFGLTCILIDAAKAAGGVQRLVYLSSAGTSARAAGAYLQARWQAEEALRHSGLPFTIARPSMIVGDREEARPAERALASVADGALRLLGALGARQTSERYRSTDDKTLAAALLRCALDPNAAGQVIESEHLH